MEPRESCEKINEILAKYGLEVPHISEPNETAFPKLYRGFKYFDDRLSNKITIANVCPTCGSDEQDTESFSAPGVTCAKCKTWRPYK